MATIHRLDTVNTINAQEQTQNSKKAIEASTALIFDTLQLLLQSFNKITLNSLQFTESFQTVNTKFIEEINKIASFNVTKIEENLAKTIEQLAQQQRLSIGNKVGAAVSLFFGTVLSIASFGLTAPVLIVSTLSLAVGIASICGKDPIDLICQEIYKKANIKEDDLTKRLAISLGIRAALFIALGAALSPVQAASSTAATTASSTVTNLAKGFVQAEVLLLMSSVNPINDLIQLISVSIATVIAEKSGKDKKEAQNIASIVGAIAGSIVSLVVGIVCIKMTNPANTAGFGEKIQKLMVKILPVVSVVEALNQLSQAGLHIANAVNSNNMADNQLLMGLLQKISSLIESTRSNNQSSSEAVNNEMNKTIQAAAEVNKEVVDCAKIAANLIHIAV